MIKSPFLDQVLVYKMWKSSKGLNTYARYWGCTLLISKMKFEHSRFLHNTQCVKWFNSICSVFHAIQPRKAKKDIRASLDLLALKVFKVRCWQSTHKCLTYYNYFETTLSITDIMRLLTVEVLFLFNRYTWLSWRIRHSR